MRKLWELVFVIGLCIIFSMNRQAFAVDSFTGAEFYTEDTLSLQVVAGSLFSTSLIGPDIATFNYVQTNVRFGWMLNSPGSWSYLPLTNLELLLELTNSAIYEGAGDYMGGARLLCRFNIVPPDSRFAPYFQLGAGIIGNNAYKDLSQDAIGESLEFALNSGLGFRYIISRKWSLDAEFAYEHISNGGLADRNKGINSLGGLIGFTYLFDLL